MIFKTTVTFSILFRIQEIWYHWKYFLERDKVMQLKFERRRTENQDLKDEKK